MMSFAEWADALDTRALEAIEADRPVQARKLIEVAEAFERRQLQIDARDFNESPVDQKPAEDTARIGQIREQLEPLRPVFAGMPIDNPITEILKILDANWVPTTGPTATARLNKIRLGIQPILDLWHIDPPSPSDYHAILKDIYAYAGGES